MMNILANFYSISAPWGEAVHLRGLWIQVREDGVQEDPRQGTRGHLLHSVRQGAWETQHREVRQRGAQQDDGGQGDPPEEEWAWRGLDQHNEHWDCDDHDDDVRGAHEDNSEQETIPAVVGWNNFLLHQMSMIVESVSQWFYTHFTLTLLSL